MKTTTILSGLVALATCSASALIERAGAAPAKVKITPRVFIIDMFGPEGDSWYGISEFDLLELNITVPGFSPLYPQAHCTSDGQICQLVTGESEINAAVSITSLILSDVFDLTKSYFLVAGIAGINPRVATISSVTFARYAVQVALQYEFDARRIPDNFTTGYIPQGSFSPTQYPQTIYGTEVFEVNENLRQMAATFARTAKLSDSKAAIAYRANYAGAPGGIYNAATKPPSVVLCDSATSDVYYSGALLSEAFGNYSTLVSNGSAIYCSTLQEDNATLEAMLRGTLAGLVDFSRIILMRTASDFDRPYYGEDALDNLFYANQGAFEPAIKNVYLAGVKVVEGIVNNWSQTFEAGIKADNYIGDILGSLPQKIKPDFGLPSMFLANQGVQKRDVGEVPNGRMMRRTGGKWRGPEMKIGGL